ncbi:hypothetical protein HanIR_Chr15g0763391 [Helianthus annuus]|nr:hypothetical protein HanIR_Chr15g0763391 [Helianthus annuus]
MDQKRSNFGCRNKIHLSFYQIFLTKSRSGRKVRLSDQDSTSSPSSIVVGGIERPAGGKCECVFFVCGFL